MIKSIRPLTVYGVMLVALVLALPVWSQNQLAQKEILAARDRVLPSLVHIEPVLEVFSGGRKQKVQVTGSGVIISASGLVLTNNHVVEKATYVRCTLSNRERLDAKVLGRDPQTDLALLQLIPPPGRKPFKAATLSQVNDLEMGQTVIALGSPLGLARSMTVGVVSSPNRFFPVDQMPSGLATGAYNTWIQTDAAINPGNSGGPMVDIKGEVVGINARAIPVFGENLGFAIPVRIARWVVPQLREKGEVSRSTLGIIWQPTQDLEEALGVRENVALVSDILTLGPAFDAGIEVGDLLTHINGQPVAGRFEEELPSLYQTLAQMAIGSKVSLTLDRKGKILHKTVTTAEEPSKEPDEAAIPGWGVTIQDLNPSLIREQNLPAVHGVLISGLRSSGAGRRAGLRRGDLLVRVEGVDITGLENLLELLRQKEKQKAYLLEVARRPAHYYYVIETTPELDKDDEEEEKP